MSQTIGAGERKARTSQKLHTVRSEDETRLRADELADELAEIDALAQEIAAAWKSPNTGVELIEEQKR